jgi:hypothetical protein
MVKILEQHVDGRNKTYECQTCNLSTKKDTGNESSESRAGGRAPIRRFETLEVRKRKESSVR